MIYLDHAATSWPKPPAVLAAMQHWFEHVGVSPSRGAGNRCQDAAVVVGAARQRLAELTGAPADRIAFVSGATEGLNLVLRALLRRGDTVLTTAFEHSSVVRPLRALQAELGLVLESLAPDPDGGLDPATVAARLGALRPQLFVFTHASNVTGACFDAAAFCRAARAHGTRTVVDACQTAGLVDLRVGADVVVASGHKALLGPPGTGFVAARPDVDLPPRKQGGTGSGPALADHPTRWPEAFEAGTPNTPGIFGLEAALRAHESTAAAGRLQRALAGIDALAAGLRGNDDWTVLAAGRGSRVPVVSAVHARYDCAEIGAVLAGAGVHVRTGHHCAPWLHAHLGTAGAGTVRFSTGPETTPAEIEAVLRVLGGL